MEYCGVRNPMGERGEFWCNTAIYLEDREEGDFIVAPIVIEKGEAVHKQEDQMQQWKREIAKEYQVAEKCIIMKKK